MLIMLWDSWDSETAQRETVMNSGKKKDSLTLNRGHYLKKKCFHKLQSSWAFKVSWVHLSTNNFGTVLARKYSTAVTAEKQELWDDDLPMKSMGFLVYATLHPLLFPNIAMVTNHHLSFIYTFARILHEVNLHFFPLSVCFLSHSLLLPSFPFVSFSPVSSIFRSVFFYAALKSPNFIHN